MHQSRETIEDIHVVLKNHSIKQKISYSLRVLYDVLCGLAEPLHSTF